MIDDSQIERAEDLVKEFLKEFGGQANFSTDVLEFEDERPIIKVSVEGEDLGEFIGYQGKNLESLQHLVNLSFNRDVEETVRVLVDINGYRLKREEYLIGVAQRAQMDATESGQPVYLPPMKAYERRVIHITLKPETDITTTSEGDEPERFVIVSPSK